MDGPKKKRVTIKPKNPNPLFEKWLTEWGDRARESDSKMQYTFSIALKSLRKYPLPLETGKECKILHGFGEKLCRMLDDKLLKYRAEIGDTNIADLPPVPQTKKPTKRKAASPVEGRDTEKSPTKSPTKDYIPKYRSGGFAILVTLYENLQGNKQLTKAEIIAKAQKLCDTSFTKPGPDTRYTGWSSMKTLLEKKLVTKQGNPPKFSLTGDGETLGEKLYIQQKIEEFTAEENNTEATEVLPSCSQATTSSTASTGPIWRQTSSTSTAGSFESAILPPNSFEIILLVDNNEVHGSKTDPNNEPILQELKRLKVPHEVRHLKVGDYVWVCRDLNTGIELVLPYIIERKRMDDFGKSIKDNRFHEQKFRLKQCGLQNLIYLVESYGKNEHVGLPFSTLMQAASNTLVQDGFVVKYTDNERGTCEYLASLTNLIKKIFEGKTLASCPKEDLQDVDIEDDLVCLMHFKEFNKTSSKTRHFKIREMFIKQLLQIKGMSLDKVLAIVEKYPTPHILRLAYKEINDSQGEKLLSSIQYGKLRKNVGPVLSKIVHQLFCNVSY